MAHEPGIRHPNSVLVFLFSFAGGILVSSFLSIPPLISVLLLVIGCGIFLIEKVLHSSLQHETLFILIVLVSFGLGSLRYAVKDFRREAPPLFEGVVVSEPEERENGRRFVFLSDNDVKALVSVPSYSDVQYGDRVLLYGEFKVPGVITDEETGREFDYGNYLAKDDIFYTMNFAEAEVLSNGEGNRLKQFLFKIKGHFVSQIRNTFAEPYASLLSGLVVAGRDAMPKNILEQFRKAGVVHIVVLSGFNIALIAEFFRRLFQNIFLFVRYVKYPKAPAVISLLGVFLFVLMTGAEATVVRAAIMASIVIFAQVLGRNYSASRALIFAAFLMVVENPKILVFDPSFQLSFIATLGLIYVEPVTKIFLARVSEKWQFRAILSQTIATQIAVLPFLVHMSGDVSIVSLFANMLILPIVPLTMFVGFISVVISYASSVIATPFAFVTHLFLSWILGVAETFGNLSFATIKITAFPMWAVIFSYLLLTYFITSRLSPDSPQLSSN